jgi:hypothetical protein
MTKWVISGYRHHRDKGWESCLSTSGQRMPEEAVPDAADLSRDHHLYDLKYRLGDLRGASANKALLLRLADSPVLFTAPHSITQLRAGRDKPAEFWTGALAETLGTILDANILTSLSCRVEEKDAASMDYFWDTLNLLVTGRRVRLVFDLHGLSARHKIDINVGSAGFPYPELVTRLEREMSERGFVVGRKHNYSGASGITGLVNHALKGVACAIQVELGPRLRSDTTSAADIRHLGDCLRWFQGECLA